MNVIQSIAIDKLVAHPGNPNRMSKANFAKLVRNIERSGRYEPLIVRPAPDKPGCFQIINGHHRCQALAKLGYKTADSIVWDIDDEQADILLATLNRLGGSDELAKKLKLLKRLNKKLAAAELAKLLPQTKKQIERLTALNSLAWHGLAGGTGILPVNLGQDGQATNTASLAVPLVFFVNDTQQQTIEAALSFAQLHGPAGTQKTRDREGADQTKAAKRAAALCTIAQYYLDHKQAEQARNELNQYFRRHKTEDKNEIE